jgi:hypothetical protein
MNPTDHVWGIGCSLPWNEVLDPEGAPQDGGCAWTGPGCVLVSLILRSPAMDFLLSYFVVLFVGSASFIAAFAAIQRHRYPPK